VRVLYAPTDGLAERDCAAARALLSGDERARCRRLHFEEDRVSFVVAHALLRCALSEATGVAPRSWRFAASASGRPEIQAPAFRSRLRFSLSHSAGLVACAVTRERDVGIDVERSAPRRGSQAVAERHFSSSEKRWLAGQPAAAAPAAFVGLWTLKEAYAKARGLGLRLALDVASFELAPRAAPVVTFPEGHGEDPRHWRFALLDPIPGYRLAVAARGATRITVLARKAPGT
jgi:4'-phosphopantetheinyl transferase